LRKYEEELKKLKGELKDKKEGIVEKVHYIKL